jgi:3-dehydrosphinganine reductase
VLKAVTAHEKTQYIAYHCVSLKDEDCVGKRTKMKDWTGKHAIVTGGSSGIGKAIAMLLIERGANISAIARDWEKLQQAKAEVEALKVRKEQIVNIVAADVSNQREIEGAIATSIERLGVPNLLITSAGIARPGYFKEQTIDIFEQTMAVNYFGSLYAVKAVLPTMQEQGKGQIVLISSGAGLIGIYGYTTYSPTKFALRGLAESLRSELKGSGVDIAIVYPPDTDTPQLIEENKTKPSETKLITASASLWKAEGVAQEVLRGIDRGSFAITPGLEMKVLARLHSVIAPLLNWYFDRLARKARGDRRGKKTTS